ncbi:MAG TPA: hypothetical protein VFQ61_21660 [Polyangiaceae bacterium]|nr:hypothetical protein [Polyangiaceae bacterium]
MPGKTVTGWLAGLALAPLTGSVSAVRRSRMFHPRGVLYRAEVEAAPASSALAGLASALAGPALVRWSSAWWKRGERTDVLGCAIRFGSDPLHAAPQPGDQDLLLATIRRPWSMAFAPWTTDFHDFLANDYYGVSPFQVGTRRVEWRLAPEREAPPGPTRSERLERAVRAGEASLRLELAAYSGPLFPPVGESFRSVVQLHLREPVELDQEALRFDPFRDGRGITPVGFVHSMRKLTYLASQRARPRHR